MIHLFIGTKAQYIKTAPFIRLLDAKGVKYNLIDSGQHASFSRELRKELRVREPDVYLKKGKDIDNVSSALAWMGRLISKIIFRPDFIKEKVFKGQKGICVIHGDTPSTLISVLMAKRAGLKVAHIEAGLRSYNYLNPFPEEFVRVVAMRLSDYLFVPNKEASGNIDKMRLKGKKIELGGNTNLEALRNALSKDKPLAEKREPYALVTFHRVETVLNRSRINFVMRLMQHVMEELRIVFVMHPFTRRKLDTIGILREITEDERIIVKELMPHDEFLRLLESCEFVITDGGSIQEEAFYLSKPCLIMRKRTERPEGLGENALLSNFNFDRCIAFMRGYKNYKRKHALKDIKPSEIIYETVAKG